MSEFLSSWHTHHEALTQPEKAAGRWPTLPGMLSSTSHTLPAAPNSACLFLIIPQGREHFCIASLRLGRSIPEDRILNPLFQSTA